MNVFAGKPSFLILAPNDDSHLTRRYSIAPILVQIAIEHPHIFRGEVIGSGVPLQPLTDVAPALLQYLTIDGTRIVLPRSLAIDDNLVLNLISLVVDQHQAGVAFDIDLTALPQDAVKLIKLHVLLELFGLTHLARDLFDHLWLTLATQRLTLRDVFWVWGALGPGQDVKWMPKSADEYLQMMAWSVLKADSEGRLDAELRTFFLEREGEPCYLTRVVEQRFLKYALSRRPRSSGESAPTKRRDTATQHSEQTDTSHAPVCLPTRLLSPPFVSSSFHPSCPFVSAGLQNARSLSLYGPIFPAQWLFSPKSKGPRHRTPQHGSIEAPYSHGKWDGKEKDVKKMAAERDGLVRLRRSESFDKSVSTPAMYTAFGYVGWCGGKNRTKKRRGDIDHCTRVLLSC